MPTTLEELETAIQDTESEANSMQFLNQNVLKEYQNRQHEVSKYVWFICASQLVMVMLCLTILVFSLAELSIENLTYDILRGY